MKHYKIPQGTPVVPLHVKFCDTGLWYVWYNSQMGLPTKTDWHFCETDILLDVLNNNDSGIVNFDQYAYISLADAPEDNTSYNAFRVYKQYIQCRETGEPYR